MKKKIIIPIVVCLFLIIGLAGFIYYNNMTISTITLDINPSVQIDLNRNNKVKKIIALNKDAKEIISNNIKGMTLNDSIKELTSNVINKGYAQDRFVVVIPISKENLINFIKKGIFFSCQLVADTIQNYFEQIQLNQLQRLKDQIKKIPRGRSWYL